MSARNPFPTETPADDGRGGGLWFAADCSTMPKSMKRALGPFFRRLAEERFARMTRNERWRAGAMRKSWERPKRLRAAYTFVVFLAAVAVLTMMLSSSCTPTARAPIYVVAKSR